MKARLCKLAAIQRDRDLGSIKGFLCKLDANEGLQMASAGVLGIFGCINANDMLIRGMGESLDGFEGY